MSDSDKSWKLQELADEAGVSPRTVRYYVQRGLLPAPAFRGKDTAYGEEHLLRLRAIRRLQDSYLPLDAIEAELKGRGPDEIRALAESSTVALASRTHGAARPPEPPENGASDRSAQTPPVLEGIPGGLSGALPGFGPLEPVRWARWTLAPGLELSLSDQADPAVRALAEALRKMAEGFRTRNGILGGGDST